MTIATLRLEYGVVEHCNLRCRSCDHASPLLDNHFVDEAVFSSDLGALSGVIKTDELRIMGGEPLLHPRLMDLLRIARASGIGKTIAVATNGTLLHRVPPEFWRSIDRLALSLYPGVQLPLPESALRELAGAHGVFFELSNQEKFRHSIVNRRIENADLVREIYRRCEVRTLYQTHTLRAGRYYKCSPAPFTRDRLALSGIVYDNAPDGVAVHGNPRLAEQLGEYLAGSEPLPACAYCLGTSGRLFDHVQLSSEELAAAVDSPDSPESLLDRAALD
jgi:GTP 3',8-cyclase